MNEHPTFLINVLRGRGGRWPVVVEYGTPETMLPVQIESQLQLSGNDLDALIAEPDPHIYGVQLGKALFREPVKSTFQAAVQSASATLNVLLRIEARELSNLHWQRLCAPLGPSGAEWTFLQLNRRTPFSLYMPSATDRRFPPINRQDLRALVVVANPDGLVRHGLNPFDDQAVAAALQRALGQIPHDLLANTAGAIGRPTLQEFSAQVIAQRYTMVHVVCHGRHFTTPGATEPETFLYLTDAENQVDRVSATRLLRQLSDLDSPWGLPHFAFLAACETALPEAEMALGGLGQRLVRDLGLPSVIAMTGRISLSTVEQLTSYFYDRLRQQRAVDVALVDACSILSDKGDIVVPALYSRLGGRALFGEDHSLNAGEIRDGLAQLDTLLPVRAPILRTELDAITEPMQAILDSTGRQRPPALQITRRELLDRLNALCTDVLDIDFQDLVTGVAPAPFDAVCPFRGLQAFRQEDARFFVGRTAIITEAVHALADASFLAVLGPSGSGKSSLVAAGITPQLETEARRHQQELRVCSMTPGKTPDMHLKVAVDELMMHPEPRLLIVDQFEETFVLCTDVAARSRFVDQLVATAIRSTPAALSVILTMRDDFVRDCAAHPGLAELIQHKRIIVGAMTDSELQTVVVQQTARGGYRLDANLANRMLDDVAGEPGAMPLLQQALTELWERRHGWWLRIAEYEKIGYGLLDERGQPLTGAAGSIAFRAEQIYRSLEPDDQQRMRDIFLRLTHLDETDATRPTQRDTRQRAALQDLAPATAPLAPLRQLVQRLADERLVVVYGGDVGQDALPGASSDVEVTHEALIRYWPRLRQWLSRWRADLLLRQALARDAQDWKENKEDTSLLYRGVRLLTAEAWRDRRSIAMNAVEAAFLAASEQDRKRGEAEQEHLRQTELALANERAAAAEKEARAAKRRVRLLRWAVALLILALVPTGAVLAENFVQSRSPWKLVTSFPQDPVTAFAWAPPATADAPQLCAGTANIGVGCSRSGAAWDIFRQDFSTGAAAQRSDVFATDVNLVRDLAFDASNTERMLASLKGGGVYLSEDGGAAWTRLGEGQLPQEGSFAVAIDDELLVAVYDASEGRRLYASTNSGRTWQPHTGTDMELNEAYTARIDSAHGIVYSGGDDGLYAASPATWQWQRLVKLPSVRYMAQDLTQPDVWWLLAHDAAAQETGVYTWTTNSSVAYPVATLPGQPHALAVDPDRTSPVLVYVLMYADQILDLDLVYAIDGDGNKRTLGGRLSDNWLTKPQNLLFNHFALLAYYDKAEKRTRLLLGHIDGLMEYQGPLSAQ